MVIVFGEYRRLAALRIMALMAIEAKKIVEKVKGDPQRQRITLYLDKTLFEKFQEACKKLDVSSNRTAEELFREFVESASSTKKR